jgi:N-acetylmuramoyl-L-alanine amidase CwlA
MVALNYQKKHIRVNEHTRSGDKLLKLQAIVVHYTANNGGDADMHFNYFNNGAGGRYAGAHIFVDRHKALEIIPLDEVAYHANERTPLLSNLRASTSYYPGGNANLLTIGIEMCLESDGSFHPDTIERTRLVIKHLQSKYSQLRDTENRVIRHYDVTGKNCPAPFVKNHAKWKEFLRSINEPIKESVSVADVNKVSPWAESNWKEATRNGYFDGKNPRANITREETAIVVNRLRENFLRLIKDVSKDVSNIEKRLEKIEKE